MPVTPETRSAPVQIEGRTLVGYGMIWGSLALIRSADSDETYTEEFAPNAFDIDGADVRFLWGHQHDRPIARTSNGTLRLRQDNRGLKLEIDMPDTSDGNDLYKLVNNRTVTSLSVGFWPKETEWTSAGLRVPHCKVIRASLREVSAVTWPAYDETELEPAGPDTAESIRSRMLARERARRQAEIDKRRRALEAAR